MEVNISKDNCFNLYFDDLNQICYTRLIDSKLYTYRGTADNLLGELSALSSMADKEFKLLAKLSTTTASTDEGNEPN